MNFLPSLTGQEEMRPCGCNKFPSNAVKRFGEDVSFGELISFQHNKEITHVEAPSSTMVLLIK
jgi:hypothetical protein